MEFVTGTASRCGGGNHYELPITISGVQRILHFTKDELERDFTTVEEAREEVIDRLRSAIKESGATTLVQIRNAISNKTFNI